jgi:hypothetical protein
MKKSAALITTALLTAGFALNAMAADMPTTNAPMAADSAPAPVKTAHHHKGKAKHKKTAAPATTR